MTKNFGSKEKLHFRCFSHDTYQRLSHELSYYHQDFQDTIYTLWVKCFGLLGTQWTEVIPPTCLVQKITMGNWACSWNDKPYYLGKEPSFLCLSHNFNSTTSRNCAVLILYVFYFLYYLIVCKYLTRKGVYHHIMEP